jgi:serine protease Do
MRWCLFFIALVTAGFAQNDTTPAEKGKSLLEQISDAFTDLADKAMPATVSIKCLISPSQEDYANPLDMFGDDFLRRFFGPQYGQPPFQQQQPQQQTSGGSGFLVSPDGYLVTNYHVVKDANQITVIFHDGREYEATIKGIDAHTDLAVLKIEEKDLPYLAFGNSDTLKTGEWVVAVGNPFGLEGTITKGIVSAKGRQNLGIARYEDFIQTDAAINPGNSGGPLLNVRGEVVGVNTAIFSRSGGYMGIGLAIPSNMVQQVFNQIMNKGSVKRGYIGIMLQPMEKDLCEAAGLDKSEGIIISDIVKDSPAAKTGLQQGDIILQYNDIPVKNVNKFRNDIATMPPGSTVNLQILRNGKKQMVSVVLGCQSEGEVITAELTQKLGLTLENLTQEKAQAYGHPADTTGLLITKVKPGSSAALAGLREGYLITGIAIDWNNQKPVRSMADFDTALEQLGDKKQVILIVRHHNYQRYYIVKLN